jgi:hypothetical protein
VTHPGVVQYDYPAALLASRAIPLNRETARSVLATQTSRARTLQTFFRGNAQQQQNSNAPLGPVTLLLLADSVRTDRGIKRVAAGQDRGQLALGTAILVVKLRFVIAFKCVAIRANNNRA